MKEYEQAVFISYAWGGEREVIVDQIDQALQSRGVKIIRDKRELGYKGSINAFMESIGRGDCVILVISDKYLRSPNCMYELVEIAENKHFQDRVFPIVLHDADIYNPVRRTQYIKYWEEKRTELADAIRTLDPANLQGIREEMDLYDRIRDKISGLTSILKDMNSLTPEIHTESDFVELYNAIEQRLEEAPANKKTDKKNSLMPTQEDTKSKAGDHSTATPGSIAVGKLEIGGDVSGNIVIGNNNQISNGDGNKR